MLARGFEGQQICRIFVSRLQDYNTPWDALNYAPYARRWVFADALDTPKSSLPNKGRWSKGPVEGPTVPSTGRKSDYALAAIFVNQPR